MKQKVRPLYIAITGDIASGKTSASKFFQEKDYVVMYADLISGTILYENSEYISEMLGMEKYDRKELRTLIFSDKEKLAKLESYLHPKIIASLQEIIDCYNYGGEDVVFFEIPLLFECKLQKGFDMTLLIIAEYDKKIKRIIKRDNCDAAEAESIIKKQLPQEEKIKLADIIIENNDDISFLTGKLEIFEQLLKYIPKRRIKRLVK